METRVMKLTSHRRSFWKKILYLGVVQLLFTMSTANCSAANEAERAALTKDGLKLVLTGSPSSPVQICQQEECEPIDFQKGTLESIENGYSDASLEDLTKDGTPELVLTHAVEGNVNTCSIILRYDSLRNSFFKLKGISKPICNYTLENNYIISSYRSGAKWHEDIYEIESGDPVLKITDSCLGCDYIERTIHLPKGKVEHLLVTNNSKHNHRVPLSTVVTSFKTILYKAPSFDQATKMYLVRGDRVLLTDFTETESTSFWYKIKYLTAKGKLIQAWINCSDLDICKKS